MKLEAFLNKSEISNIIIRAEVEASETSGVSPSEMLEEYAKAIRKEKRKVAFYLSDMAKKLMAGRKRWNVYREYLDKDVLTLIELLESSGLEAGEMFKSYVVVKEIADKHTRAIKKGLYLPIIIFTILSLIFSYVVQQFSIVGDLTDGGLMESSLFIMEYFLHITGSVLIVIIYLFIFIPRKIPLLKGIFKKLDSMLALSTINSMFDIGYSTTDIIPLVSKQFNIKIINRKGDAEALTHLLLKSSLIDVYEGASIQISIKNGSIKETIKRLLARRIEDSEALTKITQSAIANVSLLLLAIPLLMTLSVIGDVMMLMANVAGGQ